MAEIIEKDFRCVDVAKQALENLDIVPIIKPIRGGTDGSRLSFNGLSCPNLGTGGFYCHGPYEFVSITMMKKGVELLLRLVRNSVYAHEDIPF